jgi:hypothetical protein
MNVGGLHWFSEYSLSGLSDGGIKTMEKINVDLLKRNMPEIRKLLLYGKNDRVEGEGIIWDFNYVEFEQQGVDAILNSKIDNQMTSYDKWLTNAMFEIARTGSFALLPIPGIGPSLLIRGQMRDTSLEGAYQLAGAENLDFENPDHRRMIGRSSVFFAHLQRENFVGSREFFNAVRFLENEYGKEKTNNFLIAAGVRKEPLEFIRFGE